jgi:hypothetical protein
MAVNGLRSRPGRSTATSRRPAATAPSRSPIAVGQERPPRRRPRGSDRSTATSMQRSFESSGRAGELMKRSRSSIALQCPYAWTNLARANACPAIRARARDVGVRDGGTVPRRMMCVYSFCAYRTLSPWAEDPCPSCAPRHDADERNAPLRMDRLKEMCVVRADSVADVQRVLAPADQHRDGAAGRRTVVDISCQRRS